MSSIVNNQPVYISKLGVPVATDISTTPSIPPTVGTLCFDPTQLTSLFLGDGSTWNKVGGSGAITNANISNSTITNSTMTFPTTGGSPATLDFYEVFQGSLTWSGIWASSITSNITYIRLGRLVLVSFEQAVALSTIAGVIVSNAIPARFKPSQTGILPPSFPVYGVSNNIGITPYMTYDVANNRWVIYESAAKEFTTSNWGGAGFSGLLESCFMYWI